MNIYIDFDDVMCETAKAFSVIVERMFGKKVPYEDVNFFDLKKSFDLDQEEYEAMMVEGHLPEVLLSYEETPGASEVINKWLDEGHDVSIITGRPSSTYEPSRQWLDEHGLSRAKLFCVNKYGRAGASGNNTYSIELSEFYKMHFDLAVEDSPSAFKHLAHLPECTVAVFDRPWNKNADFPSDKYVRCMDWQKVLKLGEKVEESLPKKKIGLVLEGGGMRGMYTAGVLDHFMDKGLEFDGIVGVSAGALFGVNYLSKQRGRVIRYNKRFNKDKNYMGIIPLLKEGNIVSTKLAYNKVPYELDPFDNETFLKSKVPFYAVATNVDTGEAEYFRFRDLHTEMDILRASGSLPMISTPVELNGKYYLDGGIADSIPYQWMFDQGYEKLVVVLTRDASYRKGPFPKLAAKLMLRKQPAIASKMLTRHNDYNRAIEELEQLEKEGRVLLIRPSKSIKIGKLEKNEDRLQAVYDLGLSDARQWDCSSIPSTQA